MARGRVGNHLASSRQGVDADFIFGVDANQFVGAKLKEPRGRLPRELKDHRNPALSKDIDLPASKLGIAGADRYEGLYGIVCDSTNLRIHTASCELRTAVSVGKKRGCLGCQELTSSRRNKSGDKPSDRSFWIPACFPRRN